MLVGAALAAILLIFSHVNESRLKPLLQASLLLFLLTPPAYADYQSGLNAYANADYGLAMQEWRSVAEQPPGEVNPAIYAETHYAIARLYWQGQGVPRDYYKAHDWLIKAADLNHAGAMAKLGFLYTDGITVQQDFNQAFDWYSKAAKLGDVDGLYNLGIFYLNGWGTDPDHTMAKQYLAAASAQGDDAAEEALQGLFVAEQLDEQVGTAKVAIEPEEVPPVRASLARDQEASDQPIREQSSLLQDESWILAQDPDHYAIQAIGLTDRHKLEGLLKGHENLAPYAIYTVQQRTNPIHILIQGVYPTVEQARAARDHFPRSINRPDKVWIRQFGKIQEIIGSEK